MPMQGREPRLVQARSPSRFDTYAVRSDERININERVALDFLSCECFAPESFNSVFKKSSYHVLKIYNFRIDSK
jgi:hypothetical protein